MNSIQQNVLQHIGCYRITLREVLRRAIFNGEERDCERNVTKLLQAGYIESVPLGNGGYHYLKLTTKGASAGNFSKDRANVLDEASIYKALGVVWFCHMGERDAQRVELALVKKALGKALKVPYVVERPKKKAGDFKLYRIFSPDPEGDNSSLPKQILDDLDKVSALSLVVPLSEEANIEKKSIPVQALIEAKIYCIAVLVPSEEQRAATMKLLESSKKQIPASICVEAVPGPLNLQEVIRALPQEPRAPSTADRRQDKRKHSVYKKIPRQK